MMFRAGNSPPNGFAQKILGGHRPPLQLGVRNCRGALWSCEKNDLDEILGDAKHRPEVRTSFIGQINTKNFRTRSGFFSEVNLFTVPMSARDVFFVQSPPDVSVGVLRGRETSPSSPAATR